MFKNQDIDEIDLENSETDDDEEKPKIETDGEELIRRLKNVKLDEASTKLSDHMEYLKKNPKKTMKEQYQNNFIPAVVRSALELKNIA